MPSTKHNTNSASGHIHQAVAAAGAAASAGQAHKNKAAQAIGIPQDLSVDLFMNAVAPRKNARPEPVF
jgi:hypothetical protein